MVGVGAAATSGADTDAAGAEAASTAAEASSPSPSNTAMGALTFTPSLPSATKILPSTPLVDGFKFHRRLVGLDLGQQVTGADGIALLHQPFHQIALLHCGGERRHQNLRRHETTPIAPAGALVCVSHLAHGGNDALGARQGKFF